MSPLKGRAGRPGGRPARVNGANGKAEAFSAAQRLPTGPRPSGRVGVPATSTQAAGIHGASRILMTNTLRRHNFGSLAKVGPWTLAAETRRNGQPVLTTQTTVDEQGRHPWRRHLDNAHVHLAITTAILLDDQDRWGKTVFCRAGGPGKHMRLAPVLRPPGGTRQTYAVIGRQVAAIAQRAVIFARGKGRRAVAMTRLRPRERGNWSARHAAILLDICDLLMAPRARVCGVHIIERFV